MEEKHYKATGCLLMVLCDIFLYFCPKLPKPSHVEVEAREERIAEEEFAQSQVTMQN